WIAVLRRLPQPCKRRDAIAQQCVNAGDVVLRVVEMSEGRTAFDRQADTSLDLGAIAADRRQHSQCRMQTPTEQRLGPEGHLFDPAEPQEGVSDHVLDPLLRYPP